MVCVKKIVSGAAQTCLLQFIELRVILFVCLYVCLFVCLCLCAFWRVRVRVCALSTLAFIVIGILSIRGALPFLRWWWSADLARAFDRRK